jgi:hypothetical protein
MEIFKDSIWNSIQEDIKHPETAIMRMLDRERYNTPPLKNNYKVTCCKCKLVTIFSQTFIAIPICSKCIKNRR